MFQIKWFLALWFAKIALSIIRIFNFSGGTALPGLIALKIDPNFISKAVKKLHYSIIITGTNGKTTTSRMVSEILSKAGMSVLHNRSGSNLKRGVASTILEKTNFYGRLSQAVGVWEVDEAVMPELVLEIQPKILIILNLFRDQLDRYGEVETVKQKWQKGINDLPCDSFLILNGLDPSVVSLAREFKGKTLFFGINDSNQLQQKTVRSADQIYCPQCSEKLFYEKVYLSHLGIFKCPNCGFQTPNLDYQAEQIVFSDCCSNFRIKSKENYEEINLKIGGLYNILNATAAFVVGKVLNIPFKKIKKALSDFQAVFGRMEVIEYKNHLIFLYLIKNPTAANEVIRVLSQDAKSKNILVALNDKIADGTDVSWIWDVDFEKLIGKTKKIIITGVRAYDLGLRFKYAGFSKPNLITANFEQALDKTLSTKENFYFLANYTAMLNLRSKIAKRLGKKQFWEE